jgi:hypothetical protein
MSPFRYLRTASTISVDSVDPPHTLTHQPSVIALHPLLSYRLLQSLSPHRLLLVRCGASYLLYRLLLVRYILSHLLIRPLLVHLPSMSLLPKTTLVTPEHLDRWMYDASREDLGPFIPLEDLLKGMDGDKPLYGWHHLKFTNQYEVWVVRIVQYVCIMF